MNRRRLTMVLAVVGCLVAGSVLVVVIFRPPAPLAPELFPNVILMIGDGMGVGQLNATRVSLGSDLVIDSIPRVALIETLDVNNMITDSAAAATALACGVRTSLGRIAMTTDEHVLTTILEVAESRGKSTGLVTTTRLTDATPAAFAAHVLDRGQESTIAEQMLTHDVEVLLCGGQSIFSTLIDDAEARGYAVVNNRSQLAGASLTQKLLGLFAANDMNYDRERDSQVEPDLAEMTSFALQALQRNTRGFFLMVEGGRIDHACHAHLIDNVIGDVSAFDEAVGVALDFAELNSHTLLIVTADHETGGLIVNTNNPELEYSWTTTTHTSNRVPVFVDSPDSSVVPSFGHLTDVGNFLFTVFGRGAATLASVAPKTFWVAMISLTASLLERDGLLKRCS